MIKFQTLSFTQTQKDASHPLAAQSSNLLTWFALFITLLLWASAFVGIEVTLMSYTAPEVAVLRYLVASGILLIYAVLRRMSLPKLRDIPGIALLGFIGFTLYNIALNAGQNTVSVGAASFIISSEVATIALLASLFFGERLGRRGWLGIIICMVGIALISFTTGDEFQITAGAIFIFVAMLAISIFSVMQKPFLERYNAIQLTTYAIWAGTIFLLPFAPDALQAMPHALPNANIALIYLGIFPSVVGYIAWSYVLANMPAARAGSFLAIIPVAAIFIAWVLLSEIPNLTALVGGGIVLIGVVIVNNRTHP